MTKLLPLLCFLLLSCPALAQSGEPSFHTGDQAPDFTGTDQFGKLFDLSEQLDKGPVVLMFYRGYWCPYCSKQLSQMEDSLQFITERGGTVVAVTPEQPQYIEETLEKTKATFKIIHDEDLTIMKAYGVAYKMEDMLVKKYKKNGLDVAQTNGDNGTYLPVPATYIINTDGSILYAFYDPDYTKRATVSKILKNL